MPRSENPLTLSSSPWRLTRPRQPVWASPSVGVVTRTTIKAGDAAVAYTPNETGAEVPARAGAGAAVVEASAGTPSTVAEAMEPTVLNVEGTVTIAIVISPKTVVEAVAVLAPRASIAAALATLLTYAMRLHIADCATIDTAAGTSAPSGVSACPRVEQPPPAERSSQRPPARVVERRRESPHSTSIRTFLPQMLLPH